MMKKQYEKNGMINHLFTQELSSILDGIEDFSAQKSKNHSKLLAEKELGFGENCRTFFKGNRSAYSMLQISALLEKKKYYPNSNSDRKFQNNG